MAFSGFSLGSVPAISISDFDLIKEAMGKDEFSNRPVMNAINWIRGGEIKGFGAPGLIQGNGPSWLNIRRYSLRCNKIQLVLG